MCGSFKLNKKVKIVYPQRMTETNPVGRPTVMTPEVIAKLEIAFLNGATDKEAIFLGGISKDAFYDYCKLNPEFTERIDQLRDVPKYTARMNIVRAIEKGDKAMSQWYLERKVKDEFAQRSEHTGKNGESLTLQVISYNDSHNDPTQLQAETVPARITESTTEVQDSGVPQTSGQE